MEVLTKALTAVATVEIEGLKVVPLIKGAIPAFVDSGAIVWSFTEKY